MCDKVNPMTDEKILHWSKLKAFADDKIDVTEKLKFVLRRVENSVGIAGYQHFLLFPQCFQKASFSGSLKVRIEWCRVNLFPNKPWFLRVCSTDLLKTMWEKENLLVTSNFSFSHSVYYLFGELSTIFIKFEIVVCRLFQSGRV